MSAETPEAQPPPSSAPRTTAALDELWRLADQLSAAIRAHLDRSEGPSPKTQRPHPQESDR